MSGQLYMGDNGLAGILHRANVISPRGKRLMPAVDGRKRQLLESLFERRARCREPVFASASSIQTGA